MNSKKLSTTRIIALVQFGTGIILFIAVGLVLLFGSIKRDKMEVLKCRINFLRSFNRGDMDNTTGIMLTVQDVNRKYEQFDFEDQSMFGKAWNGPGDIIEIYYDKSDPSNSEVKYFWSQYGGAALVSCFGVLEFIVGLALIVVKSNVKTVESVNSKLNINNESE